MNPFLTQLLKTIAIDISHLTQNFLRPNELDLLEKQIKSEDDFRKEFYDALKIGGNNLECLALFLHNHKDDIFGIINGDNTKLIDLYTSGAISPGYKCFRFDLSKFPKSYSSTGRTLTLYRAGREDESNENLGCSWAQSTQGLKIYVQSADAGSRHESKPIFRMEVDDSQVLFEGNLNEEELVLKPNFTPNSIKTLDQAERDKIFLPSTDN
ncbi:hypothetical protein [Vibrio nigripulchritudo]|uniref:hypothetical protein n=1 Tax=Vibrio nigripulchritudo TaxID=28173 RepID=UPI0003B1B56C|nr:hypothetical protein [Vibrio nigripulchritudo]CCN69763.1 conserved hypothetical protein [Vibrio nigripulchritudo SFn118]